jgi:hypothetical protein
MKRLLLALAGLVVIATGCTPTTPPASSTTTTATDPPTSSTTTPAAVEGLREVFVPRTEKMDGTRYPAGAMVTVTYGLGGLAWWGVDGPNGEYPVPASGEICLNLTNATSGELIPGAQGCRRWSWDAPEAIEVGSISFELPRTVDFQLGDVEITTTGQLSFPEGSWLVIPGNGKIESRYLRIQW